MIQIFLEENMFVCLFKQEILKQLQLELTQALRSIVLT